MYFLNLWYFWIKSKKWWLSFSHTSFLHVCGWHAVCKAQLQGILHLCLMQYYTTSWTTIHAIPTRIRMLVRLAESRVVLKSNSPLVTLTERWIFHIGRYKNIEHRYLQRQSYNVYLSQFHLKMQILFILRTRGAGWHKNIKLLRYLYVSFVLSPSPPPLLSLFRI